MRFAQLMSEMYVESEATCLLFHERMVFIIPDLQLIDFTITLIDVLLKACKRCLGRCSLPDELLASFFFYVACCLLTCTVVDDSG